jgi:organic radical activating enzyme
MSIENAIAAWQGLIRIAGAQAKIHITGGEPFLYWEHIQQLLSTADKLNLGPADIIETNGYWAENRTEITEKLNFLRRLNVRRFKISYDPFHAEFVDYNKVKLLYEIACEVFGEDRVLFRWLQYLKEPPQLARVSSFASSFAKATEDEKATEDKSEDRKFNLFLESYKQYPFRFTGRAAGKLAQAIADKEVEQISQENCKKAFLDSKSIHIDPYGNVFNGVCSGIIIGNIEETPLDELWQKFNPAQGEFLKVLFKNGPAGLEENATKSEYKKRRYYTNKCHLCSDLRQFFFDKGQWRQIIGPNSCYT